MAKTCPCAGGGAGINSVLAETPRGSAEPAEERKLPAAAERELPRRQANCLLPGAGRRAFDRDIGKAALVALERGDHARVAAVEVLPDLVCRLLLEKKNLIGDVHRNLGVEGDVLLAAA